jgi:DNA-binding NarL/FixJ family response regulator
MPSRPIGYPGLVTTLTGDTGRAQAWPGPREARPDHDDAAPEAIRMTLRGDRRLISESLRHLLAPYADRAVIHRANPRETELILMLPAARLPDALTRLRQVSPGPEAALTRRECDVLSLVAEGLSNQEIAERLFVTGNTLKSYIRSAYRKVGVRTRAQAVRWVCAQTLADDHGSNDG